MIAALLACAVEVGGRVADPSGAPVAGAVLDAPGCRAVTAGDGAFRARCPRDRHSFAVTRPGFLDGALTVDATSLASPAPLAATLHPLPTEPGLYAANGGAIERLPAAPISARATPTEKRFCVDAGKATALAEARAFQSEDIELRAFVAEADGCFYTLSRVDSAYWSWAATPARSTPSELTPGRRWLQLHDAGALVVLAEWHQGFFVPAEDGEGGFAAYAVRVP